MSLTRRVADTAAFGAMQVPGLTARPPALRLTGSRISPRAAPTLQATLSPLAGWQEGAILSAHHAIERFCPQMKG